MDFSFQAFVFLPLGLGLLGFIEPCTIGGHLIFLGTQETRSRREKISAAMVFVFARVLVMGMIGALMAFLGQKLIDVQTGFWLIFGIFYLVIGLAYFLGRAEYFKKKIDMAPKTWKQVQSPFILGLAFGLNIPACAAPIMFGLLGLAVTTGTFFSGFSMMALFGLALSAPLLVFAVIPKFALWLESFALRLRKIRWILGTVFALLGLWSIWFGLYVDPADWSGL
ncbi:MAG: cytochrome c biogenesis protein CcdA [Alphaproteobacteria bacterium]|jgi:cytochrome c-type biogenesis protein